MKSCRVAVVVSSMLAGALGNSPLHFGYQVTLHVVKDEGRGVGAETHTYHTVEECQRLCDETTGCHSFAYHPNAGACHMKDKCVTEGTPLNYASTYQTYYKPCVGTSYQVTSHVVQDEGRGVGDETSKYHTVEECEALCDRTTGCHSFAYHPNAGACHMKDRCVTASASLNVYSDYKTYYKPCTATSSPRRRRSTWSNQYQVTSHVLKYEGRGVADDSSRWHSVSECETMCDRNPACHSFAYHPGAGACHLKDKCVTEHEPLNTNSDYKTHYKACGGAGNSGWAEMIRVVKYEGHQLKKFTGSKHTVDECKKFCDETQGCNSFSFGTMDGYCYMQSACVYASDPMVSASSHSATYKTYYRTNCGGATKLFMETPPVTQSMPTSLFGSVGGAVTAFTLAGLSVVILSFGYRTWSVRRVECAARNGDEELLAVEASTE